MLRNQSHPHSRLTRYSRDGLLNPGEYSPPVSERTHPLLSRFTALLDAACSLVADARYSGSFDELSLQAFCRGALALNRTHGLGVSPVGALAWAHGLADADLRSRALQVRRLPPNIVNPPQARDPPGLVAATDECRAFLRWLCH